MSSWKGMLGRKLAMFRCNSRLMPYACRAQALGSALQLAEAGT